MSMNARSFGCILSDPDNRFSGFDLLPFDKEH